MYYQNSRLSVMLCACYGSMLPCCSKVSRLAKQFKKSISVFCSAILKFFRMRHATYRSYTASLGLGAGAGSLAMLSQTFWTSSLMRSLFCFMRYSRKATSEAISESCSDWPVCALYCRCFSCSRFRKSCRRLTRKASSRETSIIFSNWLASNTARQCLSPLSTKTTVWVRVFNCLMSSTQRKSSQKGTLPGGRTSVGLSMTSLSEGTSSSSIPRRASCSCQSMVRLQYRSISSLQNFSSLICFCTSLQKTPNCGGTRSVENSESCFWKVMGSAWGRLGGLGDFLMRCVFGWERRDSESQPELFYSPSRISKDIQNYYAGRNNCRGEPGRQEKEGLAEAMGSIIWEVLWRQMGIST